MGPDDGSLADDGRSAFLLRVHVEPREVAGARPRVRLRVLHLQSGEEIHVTSTDEMVNFLATMSGAGEALRDWAGES